MKLIHTKSGGHVTLPANQVAITQPVPMQRTTTSVALSPRRKY